MGMSDLRRFRRVRGGGNGAVVGIVQSSNWGEHKRACRSCSSVNVRLLKALALALALVLVLSSDFSRACLLHSCVVCVMASFVVCVCTILSLMLLSVCVCGKFVSISYTYVGVVARSCCFSTAVMADFLCSRVLLDIVPLCAGKWCVLVSATWWWCSLLLLWCWVLLVE